jgi:leucyl/phenylalanyl-tRNA--protein transferase
MTIIKHDQSAERQLYWVADNIIASDFPPVDKALRDPDGLLAIGGDLSPETILNAYQKGIFPWYSDGQPILWWSPNPRCVLDPREFKISRSLGKTIRKKGFKLSFNRSFAEVIKKCAETKKGREDTWITNEMDFAYTTLHEMGHAVSVECWNEADELVGGLYGIVIGQVFFGESMFSRENDASKVAMTYLVQTTLEKQFRLIDCQVHSKHLQSLGAKPIERNLFANILEHYTDSETVHHWPSGIITL